MNHRLGRARRYAAGTVLVLAVVAAASALVAMSSCGERSQPQGGVVVLGGQGQRSRIWNVDASTRRVVARTHLRSFALSCAPASGGVVVSAQCGGLGQEADDALAIIDPHGRTRYVTLPTPNPSDVVCSGRYAVVVHGFETEQGVALSSVDVVSGSVVATSAIAGAPQRLSVVGGRVLLTRANSEGGTADGVEVVELDPASLRVRRVCRVPLAYATVLDDPNAGEGQGRALVIGFRSSEGARDRATGSAVIKLDLGSGRVSSVDALPGLRAGAFAGAFDANTLAVLDASSAEPSPDDAVVLFDRRTGGARARIRDVRPLAVALVEGRVIVADAATGSLRYYDEAGSFTGATKLGLLGMQAHMDSLP